MVDFASSRRSLIAFILAAFAMLAIDGCAHVRPPARIPAAEADVNQKAVNLIKRYESLRLTSYRYAGQWLIGYGHAGGVTPGLTITAAQAEHYLKQDLNRCERAIERAVKVTVTREEFSAMAALCYNIGTASFVGSSVVERLNSGDRSGAADAFLMWTKITVDGEKREARALRARREDERRLFLTTPA